MKILKNFFNEIKLYLLQLRFYLALARKGLLFLYLKTLLLASSSTITEEHYFLRGTFKKAMDYHDQIKTSIERLEKLKDDVQYAWSKQEMYESAKLFRAEMGNLKTLIEEYIVFERENNLPVNLEYRAILKTLKNQK